MLDPRDVAIQSTFPVVAAPRFGPLEALGRAGERFVLAANGVFMQVERAWLRCLRQVGTLDPALSLGYGRLDEGVHLLFPAPVTLLARFVDAARAALPNEIAGALVWSGDTATLRLELWESLAASAGRVEYRIPSLPRGDTVAVDLHSHEHVDAFFSHDTDDEDDRSVKLALVYGALHRSRPNVAARLCLNGVFVPLDLPPDWHLP